MIDGGDGGTMFLCSGDIYFSEQTILSIPVPFFYIRNLGRWIGFAGKLAF